MADGPIHETALEQVRFVLGHHPVRIVGPDGRSLAGTLSDLERHMEPGECVLLGLRLSPIRELAGGLLGLLGYSGNRVGCLRSLRLGRSVGGFRVAAGVAVLPDVSSARFGFPLGDGDSHRFLVQQILVPRRYALPPLTRGIMWVYVALVRLLPAALFLYRGAYVRLERT